jgi:hypothetical protein
VPDRTSIRLLQKQNKATHMIKKKQEESTQDTIELGMRKVVEYKIIG